MSSSSPVKTWQKLHTSRSMKFVVYSYYEYGFRPKSCLKYRFEVRIKKKKTFRQAEMWKLCVTTKTEQNEKNRSHRLVYSRLFKRV
jgi:hypothetical protein